METGNVKFERGIYYRYSVNEHEVIFNYQLKSKSTIFKNSLLTEIVRIEKDNGFHDRSREFDYWLYFRNDTNWKRCFRTGLAKTSLIEFFEGNISKELNLQMKNSKGKNLETPQHLVIIKQNDNFENISIDVFKDFYIHDKRLLKIFIDEHFQKYYSNKVIEDHE